jgi:hypothetical protein
MRAKTVDVVVLGGGTVAVIENRDLGGTCPE